MLVMLFINSSSQYAVYDAFSGRITLQALYEAVYDVKAVLSIRRRVCALGIEENIADKA